MTNMRNTIAALLFLSSIFFYSTAWAAKGCVETTHLIVCDLSWGQLSNDHVEELAHIAENKLQQVLDFWSANGAIERWGKIHLELDRPRGGTYGTQFRLITKNGTRTRTVRVFGGKMEPQNLVHKLTVAVFPSTDKLIRNMMGGPMEARFGNRKSFPMCGFSNDSWVLSLRRIGAYIRLAELGPVHEPWGMTTGRDGWPYVTDEWRQHVAYAEAVSFGDYLLVTYGPEVMKAFYRLSRQDNVRPWARVFGKTLAELEEEWTRHLESSQVVDEKENRATVELLAKGPGKTCPARLGD